MNKFQVTEKLRCNHSTRSFHCKELKLNDKGVTLVELIIAIAVSTIVIAMVITFLTAGTKSYTSANDEVSLQMESQTVMNQLEDMIMGSYWTEIRTVEVVDAIVNVKALIIYNEENIDVIYWDREAEKLYLVDEQTFDTIRNLSSISYTDEENLMAVYVKEIEIPTNEDDILAKKGLQLVITFENDSNINSIVRNITFRNGLKIPSLITPTPTVLPST